MSGISDIERRAGADMVPLVSTEDISPRALKFGDHLLASVIPEDRLPIDCNPVLEKCASPASVYVTSSSGYEQRPLCAGHAHVVFAEWMVGI
jgi:hypothetical protein